MKRSPVVMSEADRTSYIGGPCMAAILGVHPYSTPVAEWLRLTGRTGPIEVNDAMRSGHRLERAVLDYAGEELGVPIKPGPFILDLSHHIGGHLDGVPEACDKQIVEAKTVRNRKAWGEPGSGEVPPHVAAQALHYMGLAGADVCWVPVLFSGLEFAMFRVERDDAVIEQMRDMAAKWWTDYVVADLPPPPQTGEDAKRLFPSSAPGKAVIASDAVAEAVERLREVRDKLVLFEADKDALEGTIKVAMGDADTLLVRGEPAATWRSAKPAMRFDSSAFKLAEPEQYRAYSREVASRRFLLKG
jgi:putative phage-type endonuclease